MLYYNIHIHSLTKNNIPGGVRSCSVVLSISSLSTTRAGNSSSNDTLQLNRSMDSLTIQILDLLVCFSSLMLRRSQNKSEMYNSSSPHTLWHLFLHKISINLPRGRGACLDQQRSEDLPQRVCVQAIAGLCLGDLGQVCEEVLQGETVMERDGGGALQDQAYLSVMASSDRTIWKRYSNNHEGDLYIKLKLL